VGCNVSSVRSVLAPDSTPCEDGTDLQECLRRDVGRNSGPGSSRLVGFVLPDRALVGSPAHVTTEVLGVPGLDRVVRGDRIKVATPGATFRR